MLAKFHKFAVNRLLLSQVAVAVSANKAWEDELELILDLHMQNPYMPFAEMLQLYCRASKHMQMPRTSICDFPKLTLCHLLHRKNGQDYKKLTRTTLQNIFSEPT